MAAASAALVSSFSFHLRKKDHHSRFCGGVRCGVIEPSGKPAPVGEKTRYRDSIIDKAFISLFKNKMLQFTGESSSKEGYEGFVEVSRGVLKSRTPAQQRTLVRQVLLSILPPGAPEQFRKLFPPTRWAAEFNASLTVPFFQWLVGPCEKIEVEIDGIKQNSGVRILKCRYLENSGCTGMCVNLCKIPTQDFFTNDFGLPLTMKPNFEDMSCEMIYGQTPPPLEEDPALKQSCLLTCQTAVPSNPTCPKITG